MRRRVFYFIIATCCLFSLTTPALSATPVRGGVLKIASETQPATMDGHWTTAHSTHAILYQTHETLFAIDKNFKPVPMLATGYAFSGQGKTLTLSLRKGVLFHDGNELTAKDVIASLQRWGQKQGAGRKLFADVTSITAPDDYTIIIKLKNVVGPIISLLGINQSANPWIYPKRVLDEAGDKQIADKNCIGTGPFMFVEFKPDRYVKLRRFEEYTAIEGPASGMAGKKVAYFDEIYFNFIPDPSVRISSVEAGEADFAAAINYDEYPRLKDSKTMVPVVVMPRITVFARMNMKAGPMSNPLMRQAFVAALDCEDIMRNAIGVEGLYFVSPSVMTKMGIWNSDVGKENYNQNNKAKARELLKKAGYKGEPIRWLTSKQYPYMYTSAMAAKPHLEKAGFNVKLQVMEWAQLSTIRYKEDQYEIFSTGIGNTIDPSNWIALDPKWAGWWDTPEKEALREALWRTVKFEDRKNVWDKLQALFFEQVPLANFGETGTLHVMSPKVNGLVPHANPFFWNVWLAK